MDFSLENELSRSNDKLCSCLGLPGLLLQCNVNERLFISTHDASEPKGIRSIDPYIQPFFKEVEKSIIDCTILRRGMRGSTD
jgi:hypothetical protein